MAGIQEAWHPELGGSKYSMLDDCIGSTSPLAVSWEHALPTEVGALRWMGKAMVRLSGAVLME